MQLRRYRCPGRSRKTAGVAARPGCLWPGPAAKLRFLPGHDSRSRSSEIIMTRYVPLRRRIFRPVPIASALAGTLPAIGCSPEDRLPGESKDPTYLALPAEHEPGEDRVQVVVFRDGQHVVFAAVHETTTSGGHGWTAILHPVRAASTVLLTPEPPPAGCGECGACRDRATGRIHRHKVHARTLHPVVLGSDRFVIELRPRGGDAPVVILLDPAERTVLRDLVERRVGPAVDSGSEAPATSHDRGRGATTAALTSDSRTDARHPSRRRIERCRRRSRDPRR